MTPPRCWGSIGPKARLAVGPLTEMLADETPSLREAAAAALGKMGPAAEIRHLASGRLARRQGLASSPCRGRCPGENGGQECPRRNGPSRSSWSRSRIKSGELARPRPRPWGAWGPPPRRYSRTGGRGQGHLREFRLRGPGEDRSGGDCRPCGDAQGRERLGPAGGGAAPWGGLARPPPPPSRSCSTTGISASGRLPRTPCNCRRRRRSSGTSSIVDSLELERLPAAKL